MKVDFLVSYLNAKDEICKIRFMFYSLVFQKSNNIVPYYIVLNINVASNLRLKSFKWFEKLFRIFIKLKFSSALSEHPFFVNLKHRS